MIHLAGTMFEPAWDALSRHPRGSTAYTDALKTLLSHDGSQLMQAPLFVDDESAISEDLQRQLMPLCPCGHRWLFVPDLRRNELLATATEQTILLSDGGLIELAPWGGDRQSATLRLHVKEGYLYTTFWPYIQAERHEGDRGCVLMVEGTGAERTEAAVIDLRDPVPLTIHRVRAKGRAFPLCRVEAGPSMGIVRVQLDGGVKLLEGNNEPWHVCAYPN